MLHGPLEEAYGFVTGLDLTLSFGAVEQTFHGKSTQAHVLRVCLLSSQAACLQLGTLATLCSEDRAWEGIAVLLYNDIVWTVRDGG